jgi:hypothetical protein
MVCRTILVPPDSSRRRPLTVFLHIGQALPGQPAYALKPGDTSLSSQPCAILGGGIVTIALHSC